MAEETAAAAGTKPQVEKKPKKAAVVPKSAKSTHPPASQMVLTAITELKERNGSSLQAIKKFIAIKYSLEPEKQALFIKKYLKSAVANGALIQTKGSGAAGSFKLPVVKKTSEAKPKVPKKNVVVKTGEKAAKAAKPKVTAVTKKSPKKSVVSKTNKSTKPKAAAAKKPAVGKKSAKTPTAKPKNPKSKIAAKKVAAKK